MTRTAVFRAAALFAALSLFQTSPAAESVATQPMQIPVAPQADSKPAAQSQSSPQGISIKVDVDTVLLNVSVLDRKTNRTVFGLKKSDFLVYEDGALQQVQQVAADEAPFDLLLLLDVSGSTSSYLNLMKEAAIEFTREINENDRIAVAVFNSKVKLLQDFTNDREAAAKAIDQIHAGGGTAFYDALMTSINDYMAAITGRKAIVVFTDGVDNRLYGDRRDGSRASYDELFRRVQEADALIYTIFLNSEGRTPVRPARRPSGPFPRTGRSPFPLPLPVPSPFPVPTPGPSPSPREAEKVAYEIARDQLDEIARQTGGRVYAPRGIEDLEAAYYDVAADLSIQYLLEYVSSNPVRDDRWRSIKVEVPDHRDAVVRTREGYYAASRHP